MDLIDRLEQEHKELEYMMDELCHLQDGERKSHDYLASFRRIIAHEGSEEGTIYPAMMRHPGLLGVVRQGCNEQRALRKIIDSMGAMTPDNALWAPRLEELRDMLRNHIRTEEDDIFMKARGTISPEELEDLDGQYVSMKRELETPPAAAVHSI